VADQNRAAAVNSLNITCWETYQHGFPHVTEVLS
jgi:hypothetical protein